MKCNEIMTPSMCTPEDNVAVAINLMWDYDCGAVPVVKDLASNELVGVVTDRDIAMHVVKHACAHPSHVKVGDCMATAVVACQIEDLVERAIQLMGEHRIRRIPIVDPNGCCVGIISQADLLLRAALIVGNMTPAHAERYNLSDAGLTRFVRDFYSYKVCPDGRPESPLGSYVNAYTAGGLIEGGYLGFAELQYVHMPLPGERLVVFLSDGAFEEQRGGDWAPRWFPPTAAVSVFLSHTRPEPLLGVMRPLDTGQCQTRVLGYINHGGTFDVSGMLFANHCTWAHAVVAVTAALERAPEELLNAEELGAIRGETNPAVIRTHGFAQQRRVWKESI